MFLKNNDLKLKTEFNSKVIPKVQNLTMEF